MTRWIGNNKLLSVAVLVLGLTVIPAISLLLWVNTHELTPLSVEVDLSQGEYRSALFTTDINDNYQIELDSLPYGRISFDIEWKVVSEAGVVLHRGIYKDEVSNVKGVTLGHYQSSRGLRQRLVLDIRQGVSSKGAHSKLEVGLPELGLRIAEGYSP